MSERIHPNVFQLSTTATTRIPGWDAVSVAIGVAQTVFPATRPNTVVLMRPDYYPEALAASRLLRHPFDAVILFTESDTLEEAVSRELVRLSPRGNGVPAQVILIGHVHSQIMHDVARLGFTLTHLTGQDLWDTVKRINEFELDTERRDVLLVSSDPLAGGVVAGGYAAYLGTPILFASDQGLSPEARDYLRRHPKSRVYIAAPEVYLSRLITSEIRHLGSKVEAWIGGGDALEMSTRFAEFRDSKARFGWGKREKGAVTLSLVPIGPWAFGVAAAALSQHGKQTPLLLTRGEQWAECIGDFLTVLRPRPSFDVRSHAFVVGGLDVISYPVQMRLHQALTTFDG